MVERHVGEHPRHERLVVKFLTEDAAVAGVFDRLPECGTHQPCGCHRAIKPGQRDHVENGLHPPARLADQMAERPGDLHFRGSIGLVAELVLQALETQAVFLPVAQKPRHQEATQPLLHLGEDEECIAHGCRHEPFVPGDAVDAITRRFGAGRVGTHVGAALFLRHAHADGDAGLRNRCTV